MYVCVCMCVCVCNVTLGILYFISPANGHAHRLPMYYSINRLS